MCESELELIEEEDTGSGWIQPVLQDIVKPLVLGIEGTVHVILIVIPNLKKLIVPFKPLS